MVVIFVGMVGVGTLDAAVVALIVPLVQTIIQPDLLKQVEPFAKISDWLGFEWSSEVFPWLAGILVLLIVASSVANLIVNWIMDQQAAKCRNRLGHEIVYELISAPFLWFLSKNTAILARQVFADIRVWRNDFLQSVMQIAQSVVLILTPSTVVVVLAPSYGLLAIIVVGLLGLLITLVVRPRIHQLVRRQKANMDATMRVLQQLLTGIREVKVSNRMDFFTEQFDKYHERGNHYFTDQRLLSQLSPNLILTLGQVGFIAAATLLWASGISGAEVTAQLAMLAVVVSKILPAINKGASHFNTLIASLPFVDALLATLQEVDNAKRTHGRSEAGEDLPTDWQTVRMDEVSFEYPNAKFPSINGLTFTLERGKRYGIVGRSGAGKSTLVNLLLGLLQPTNGHIYVDGMPLASIDLGQWRNHVGYVPQDVFLLDDSLRANIAFGETPARVNEQRLLAAVDQARLASVVSALPQGLDTPMGERGRRLSGGQAQRVAIARALYRLPSIVILDEATSALDSMTEADIQASFDALGNNVLAIAIAHRISSLRNCHEIIVLDDGKIHDIGSYDELLEHSSLFRDLAAKTEVARPS